MIVTPPHKSSDSSHIIMWIINDSKPTACSADNFFLKIVWENNHGTLKCIILTNNNKIVVCSGESTPNTNPTNWQSLFPKAPISLTMRNSMLECKL